MSEREEFIPIQPAEPQFFTHLLNLITRHACEMATGSDKTTVMDMLVAAYGTAGCRPDTRRRSYPESSPG